MNAGLDKNEILILSYKY